MDAAGRDHDFVRRADRNAVNAAQLLGEEVQQSRHAGGLDVVAVVVVDGPVHRALDRVRRVEAHVSLIEPERILDGVHHVADADDAGERHRVEEMPHEESIRLWDRDWPPLDNARFAASLYLDLMTTRRYRAGESLEDFCRACKTDRMHTVVAADADGRRRSASSAAIARASTTIAAARASAGDTRRELGRRPSSARAGAPVIGQSRSSSRFPSSASARGSRRPSARIPAWTSR